MHYYFSDYIIRKSYLTSGLCNSEVFFKCLSDYIIHKLVYGGEKMIKMYFHIVYGGDRRIYEGVGKNSLRGHTRNLLPPLGFFTKQIYFQIYQNE